MAFLDGVTAKKKGWLDDPGSLLKEDDFSNAQKSMRTEVKNKTDLLRSKSLAIPGEGDDRNWLEKKLNTPQNKGFLGDTLDILTRGNYASANIAKSLTDNKKDSFRDILGAGYKGLSGQERVSYRDVLEQSGMKKGALRSTLGFAGDVLLDPTTYLTLGVGTGAKIGGKVAAKGLGKAIPKALGKEAIDRGGIKFMGASLIPGRVIEKGAEKAGIFKAGNLLRDSKAGQVLGKGLVPNFREAGTDKKTWESFVAIKKAYEKGLSYTQNKAVEDAIKMAKGFTQAERTQATHAIQDIKLYNAASPKIRSLADKARMSFFKSSNIEQDLGLLKNLAPNYVPGIYPEKAKGFLQGITNNQGLKATLGSHNKKKKFPTLQDAIKAGLRPETDIVKLVGTRQVTSARAVETQKFINETLAKFGTKINAKNIDKIDPSMGVYLPKGSLALFPSGTVPDEIVQLVKGMGKDDLIEIPARALKSGMLVSKNVPVYALPKQIATTLNNSKKATTDEGSKGILRAYDNVLNLWKAYATAVNPGFHARNAQSNVFQAGLASSKSLLNPMNHINAAKTNMTNLPIVGQKIANQTIDIGGQKMKVGDVVELMKKEGVHNTGWIAKDIPNYIKDNLDAGLSNKLAPKSIAQLLNPLSQKNALIRGGRAVGSSVENQGRSFGFLSALKNTGGDIKESAKIADKTFFDYGDVTKFEQDVLKRTIPFYTWMRKNVPLQAENIVRTPGKYSGVNKALDGVRDLSDPVDETNLPEYMNTPTWVKTPLKQSGKPMYWNSNLPYGDLEKLNPSKLGETALGSLAPTIKAPMEMYFNKNSFFGNEIERFPGEMKKAPGYVPDLPEPVVKMLGAQYGVGREGVKELQVPAKVRFMMSQVPFMENVSKSIDLKGEKKFNQLLSFLMGSKIAPFDMKKAEMNALYDQRDALRDAFDKYQTQGVLAPDEDLAEEKKKNKAYSNPFR